MYKICLFDLLVCQAQVCIQTNLFCLPFCQLPVNNRFVHTYLYDFVSLSVTSLFICMYVHAKLSSLPVCQLPVWIGWSSAAVVLENPYNLIQGEDNNVSTECSGKIVFFPQELLKFATSKKTAVFKSDCALSCSAKCRGWVAVRWKKTQVPVNR